MVFLEALDFLDALDSLDFLEALDSLDFLEALDFLDYLECLVSLDSLKNPGLLFFLVSDLYVGAAGDGGSIAAAIDIAVDGGLVDD